MDEGASRRVHHRRLPPVPGPARRAGHLAAVGHARTPSTSSTARSCWKVPLGEYPQLVAKGIRNTGTLNFGGAVATAGGLVFVAATADEKIRAFEKHSGRVLWEHQLPAGGYATPSVYMIDGTAVRRDRGGRQRQERARSRATPSSPSRFPTRPRRATTPAAHGRRMDLALRRARHSNGWVHMNGAHTFTVEDGAIVGRTVESSAQHELVPLLAAGVRRLRARARDDGRSHHQPGDPDQDPGAAGAQGPARASNPRPDGSTARRSRCAATTRGSPTTGMLYGEALGTDWLSSQQKIDQGHPHFVDEGLEQAAHRRPRPTDPDLRQRPTDRGPGQRGRSMTTHKRASSPCRSTE